MDDTDGTDVTANTNMKQVRNKRFSWIMKVKYKSTNLYSVRFNLNIYIKSS